MGKKFNLSRWRLFAPALFTTLPFLSLAAPSTNQPYEDALKSYYQSDIKSAIIHLKNALKANPDHLPSRILMAEALIAQGNGMAAEVELNYVRKQGADENRTLPLILEAYLLQSKYDLVIEKAQVTNRTKRIEGKVLVLKGRAYLAKRQLSSAEQAFQLAFMANSRDAQALLGLAQVEKSKNKLDKATELAQQVLLLSPGNNNALLLLAGIYQMQDKLGMALKYVNQLLNTSPDNFPGLLTRAQLLIDNGKYQQAQQDVDIILQAIPNEPRANYLKSVIVAALGDSEEYRKTFSHLNVVLTGLPDPVKQENPVYYYLAGLVSFQKAEYIKARNSLRKYIDINSADLRAIKLYARTELVLGEAYTARNALIKARLLNPKDIEVWSLLGKAYADSGEFEKAERYFIDVVENSPGQYQPLVDLANLQLTAKQFQLAVGNLMKAKDLTDEPEVTLLLAQALRLSQQPEKGLVYVKELINNNNKDSYLFQLQGVLLGLSGKHQLAQSSFEQALELDKKNYQAAIHLARIDMLNGKALSAVSRLKNQLDLDAGNTSLMVELGQVYRDSNDLSKAIFWFEKAYSIDRSDEATLTPLVNSYALTNKLDKAITVAEDYLTRFSKNENVYLLIAKLYLQNKQNTKAINAHQLAVKHAENRSFALLEMAKTQELIGDVEGTVSSLQKSIAWNNKNVPAYLKLIGIYSAQKDVNNALALMEKLYIVNKDKALDSYLKGELYRIDEQFGLSEKFYRKALSKTSSQQGILGLYRVLNARGKYQESIKLLEQWMSNHSQDLLVALALAETYKLSGKLKQTAAYYGELLDRFPDTPVLLNNAAQVQIALGGLSEASKLADKAYQCVPNNIAIIDTVAWIKVLQGKHEEALPLFRQAMALDFDNLEVKYHLAVALHKLGRLAEARRHLTDVLDGGEPFAERVEAKKLLDEIQGL